MTTVLPDPPRSALIDSRTGMLAREWVLFFDALRRAIVSGLDDSVGGRLDALESDSLFSGGDSDTGSTDYNDTVVRGRLDDLEIEQLWTGIDPVEHELDESNTETDLSELIMTPDATSSIRRLTGSLKEANLLALTQGDATAAIRQLRRSIRDLETAQAMVTDQTGLIAAVVRRLQELETEGAFP